MIYAIEARIAIEYIDLHANDRGIKTIVKGVKTTVDAKDETEAQETFRKAALPYFPGCWQLKVINFETLKLD